jgi:hypothetical protein
MNYMLFLPALSSTSSAGHCWTKMAKVKTGSGGRDNFTCGRGASPFSAIVFAGAQSAAEVDARVDNRQPSRFGSTPDRPIQQRVLLLLPLWARKLEENNEAEFHFGIKAPVQANFHSFAILVLIITSLRVPYENYIYFVIFPFLA